MCRHPCWPTPDEAKAIIGVGLGDKLMVDYWINIDRPDTDILCPAVPGYEGRGAPSWREFSDKDSRCVFQSADGLCELHDMGLKPIEGRLSLGCKSTYHEVTHEYMFRMWDNEDAQELVSEWRKE